MLSGKVHAMSGKVHAIPTRYVETATDVRLLDAAAIICDMGMRSGGGFPDVLVVDHTPS